MSTELRRALERVAGRFRSVRLWGGLALCWLAWALVGWGMVAVLSHEGPAKGWIPASVLIGWAMSLGGTGLACARLAGRSARDPRWVARRIEARHPELGTGLLAAVEEDAAGMPGRIKGFLQAAVIREALEHARSHDWREAVPSKNLRGAKLAHAASAGLLIAATVALAGHVRSAALGFPPPPSVATADGGFDVKVEPGDASIEKGTTLLVVARFPAAVPADASLAFSDSSKTQGRRPMARSLEDPTFAGRVESVDADLTYRVEFGGRTSPTYRVTVFEYPELVRADARLVFPAYTAVETRAVEDIRHVTAVEGTELTLTGHLNKEVAEAKLVDEKGTETPLRPSAGDPLACAATFTLAESHRYKVRLVDRDGRANKLAAEIAVNVTRNRPAAVAVKQPARDVRVSPVEELQLRAQVDDDFGVTRHGLAYAVAGQEPRELILETPAPSTRKTKAEHVLAFEGLKARPDELVTYFFWAEDVGPDGKPRRTSGDMYFAEVRHFEEIFRQGEPPPSGSDEQQQQQGGNAQQVEKLAELQKQVINGTWKLIRRELSATPTAPFAADARAVLDGQRSAIEQARALAEKLQDATSKENLDRAARSMKDAESKLVEASGRPAIAPLAPALASGQAAYQALLKLRAREFEVTRRNSRQQQSGSASSGSPSQQQLDQLELTDEQNRYEQQSKARQEQASKRDQEQAETRQVVNRLRELARRQADLNDRLKELQSALEAAREPKAREEIERQLKRLRDQEQQILRDTDELRERMEQEQNRERMADARQQVEQGREHVRQASEALEQGRLSQAVTEGTRAGQELDKLREEIRKDASGRFADDLTEMRDQARKLDEDQGKLTEKIEAKGPDARPSLREPGDRQQARRGLEQQRKDVDQLLDRMRRTVEDAEETQPLLAKDLFDTVKKATQPSIPDTLKVAEQLVDAGVTGDAAELSRKAGQGIGQMREGVEKAARSVLGDGTDALKRAQGELDDLADQVNRELARATPDSGLRTQDSGRPHDGRQGQQPGQPGQPGQQGQQGGQGDRRQGQSDQQAESGQQGQQPGQGQQPNDRQGQQPGGQGQSGQQGQQPGEGQQGQQADQQGGQPRQGDQQGRSGQQGQQPGQPGQQGQQPGPGDQQGRPGPGGRQGGSPGGGGNPSGLDRVVQGLSGGEGGGSPGGPITGEGFRRWSDRMRDVEELLDDPQLRAEAARIRDRVRGAREEFKRHSREPDPRNLKEMVADPIRELRDRVAEEVRRRESPDSLVPIDRDPVPPQFAEGVRRYYERLGSGR